MDESQANQTALAQGRAFVWHEISTSDIDASIEFYTSTLDFGTLEMDMGDMGSYKMLTRNGAPVCGVTSTQDGVPPHWAAYLGVDDVDARAATAVDHGATVLVPALDVPTVGRMTLIQDPQGARIWLFKSEG